VKPEGLDINYIPTSAEETFFRMTKFKEFDVAEMSLSTYVLTLTEGKSSPFVAIPVFPSRSFRHSSIFINGQGRVSKPRDLVGKKVGLPEYQLTACVWIRGILSEEYKVPVESVSYFTGGLEEAGRQEKLKVRLPRNIHVTRIRKDQTLSSMLEADEIDALYSPRAPVNLVDYRVGSNVIRLFKDYEVEEKRYFKKTRIFPIMHVIVIRRELYERNKWLARSLYKGFVEAQRIAYVELSQTFALAYMDPWLGAHVGEARQLMGYDYWPYGLEDNEKTLATFLRYSFEQGLAKRLLRPEHIFAPETQETFKI
jgi:4,5-dihydroxyphthalate decarboxylase